MGVITVSSGAEKECSTVITISEPGYYRIGAGVRTVGCKSGSFTVVDGGIGRYGFRGGTYAIDMIDTEIPQWVCVEPWALNGGSLQFEVSCLEGAEDGQLLVRDTKKESVVNASASIAQMSAGVSSQAVGAADARAGWTRGL